MIKCVGFDLDGTLYDYDKPNDIAERKLYEFMKNEFHITFDDSKMLLYKAKNKLKEELLNTASSHNRLLYMQLMCEEIHKNPLLYARKMYHIYWDNFIKNMALYDYVKMLFIELKNKNIKIAILTDLTAYIQYRKLEYLGICEYIDYLITSEEVGVEKPNIKNFEKLIEKVECYPNEILFVGDDIKKDIEGAENANISVVHYDINKNMFDEVIKYL